MPGVKGLSKAEHNYFTRKAAYECTGFYDFIMLGGNKKALKILRKRRKDILKGLK